MLNLKADVVGEHLVARLISRVAGQLHKHLFTTRVTLNTYTTSPSTAHAPFAANCRTPNADYRAGERRLGKHLCRENYAAFVGGSQPATPLARRARAPSRPFRREICWITGCYHSPHLPRSLCTVRNSFTVRADALPGLRLRAGTRDIPSWVYTNAHGALSAAFNRHSDSTSDAFIPIATAVSGTNAPRRAAARRCARRFPVQLGHLLLCRRAHEQLCTLHALPARTCRYHPLCLPGV